jgi:inositol transport system substrate-binding protein
MMVVGMMAGCGGKEKSSDGEYKIGLTLSDRDKYLTSMEKASLAEATAKNVTLDVQDSKNSVDSQISHIAFFVKQGYDAIIVNLVDVASVEDVIDAAKDTPIVFVNRMPDESVLEANKIVAVSSVETEAGEFQAEFLTDYFAEKETKTLDVVMITGADGHLGSIGRTEAVLAGLESSGFTVNLQYQDTADWDRAKAMKKIQGFFLMNKPVDVIICNNDEMAIGAIEAIKAIDKTTDDICVVGVDATTEGIASIADRDLKCTVFQDAVAQGAGSVDAAVQLASGEDVVAFTPIAWDLVTLDNLDKYMGV